LCCALMLRAFATSDPPLLPCARRLIVRAPSMSVPFGLGPTGASRRRLASASLKKPQWPPCCSSGADHRHEPVIAVALSDDSQQHRRLGHDSHCGFLGDGRIGYRYTDSRFARGAIADTRYQCRKLSPLIRRRGVCPDTDLVLVEFVRRRHLRRHLESLVGESADGQFPRFANRQMRDPAFSRFGGWAGRWISE